MAQKNQPDVGLDLHDRRRLAVDAEVDLRTLERALAGEPIKALSRHRIVRALSAKGLLDLLPPATQAKR